MQCHRRTNGNAPGFFFFEEGTRVAAKITREVSLIDRNRVRKMRSNKSAFRTRHEHAMEMIMETKHVYQTRILDTTNGIPSMEEHSTNSINFC